MPPEVRAESLIPGQKNVGSVKNLVRARLSNDTKAVLRVLRRQNELVEAQLHRIANAVVSIQFAIEERLGSDNVGMIPKEGDRE